MVELGMSQPGKCDSKQREKRMRHPRSSGIMCPVECSRNSIARAFHRTDDLHRPSGMSHFRCESKQREKRMRHPRSSGLMCPVECSRNSIARAFHRTDDLHRPSGMSHFRCPTSISKFATSISKLRAQLRYRSCLNFDSQKVCAPLGVRENALEPVALVGEGDVPNQPAGSSLVL